MKRQMRIVAAAVAMGLALMALAPTAAAQGEPVADPKGQALVAAKIAANFNGLAGGSDNSLALVNALRTGSEVRLVTVVPPPAGSPPGTESTLATTTFTPPTKPMGWGNVKHALALARDQLARAGIANPTAEQLQTALMGGDLVATNANGTTTTTPVRGVLTMRADGMGWGNIAKAGGTQLGPVTSRVDMSAKGVKSTGTASTGVTTAAAQVSAAPKASRGLVTAAGTETGVRPRFRGGETRGLTPRGIVTGAGSGSTNVAAAHGRPAHAGGAGLVTGSGNSASAGITNAGGGPGRGGGNAGGNGNGHGKGRAG